MEAFQAAFLVHKDQYISEGPATPKSKITFFDDEKNVLWTVELPMGCQYDRCFMKCFKSMGNHGRLSFRPHRETVKLTLEPPIPFASALLQYDEVEKNMDIFN